MFIYGCMAQVGDYVDTLLLPSSGMKSATVRWIPGPVEITGALLLLVHMSTQSLDLPFSVPACAPFIQYPCH